MHIVILCTDNMLGHITFHKRVFEIRYPRGEGGAVRHAQEHSKSNVNAFNFAGVIDTQAGNAATALLAQMVSLVDCGT